MNFSTDPLHYLPWLAPWVDTYGWLWLTQVAVGTIATAALAVWIIGWLWEHRPMVLTAMDKYKIAHASRVLNKCVKRDLKPLGLEAVELVIQRGAEVAVDHLGRKMFSIFVGRDAVRLFTDRQLAAAVAHECGHIGQMLERLRSGQPIRVGTEMSHKDEYEADLYAAEICGAGTIINALKRYHKGTHEGLCLSNPPLSARVGTLRKWKKERLSAQMSEEEQNNPSYEDDFSDFED